MTFPEFPTLPLYVDDPRLQIAIAALRVIAKMPGYSPDKPCFRVVAQTALKEIQGALPFASPKEQTP